MHIPAPSPGFEIPALSFILHATWKQSPTKPNSRHQKTFTDFTVKSHVKELNGAVERLITQPGNTLQMPVVEPKNTRWKSSTVDTDLKTGSSIRWAHKCHAVARLPVSVDGPNLRKMKEKKINLWVCLVSYPSLQCRNEIYFE